MLGNEMSSTSRSGNGIRRKHAAPRSSKPRPVGAARADRQAPKPPLIALPEPDLQLSQDSEWCLVKRDGEWRQIRFHDYHEVYQIPGLYEKIFYRILKCDSPSEIRQQLQAAMSAAGDTPASLRALDLGAGNGMVGEQLTRIGVETIVGIDIIPEARTAALRDRPTVYDDYFVLDFTNLSEAEKSTLKGFHFNCMTCVAALGFGDIPALAFTQAVELVNNDGWLAFNIKDEFLRDSSKSEFAKLIDDAAEAGAIEIKSRRSYVHRLATDGQPLEYIAIIAQKRRDLFEFLPGRAIDR